MRNINYARIIIVKKIVQILPSYYFSCFIYNVGTGSCCKNTILMTIRLLSHINVFYRAEDYYIRWVFIVIY